ncbi:Undecaprenyl-phosphate glucose phosphotransferase [Georgfuchsia toluolica]|uniref:Undecaprenyl-phosphate glucose phosphotransferase n=1 Tax=Georgfuchsia toluolica TaxID=424218 RepID=A0A916J0E8_9PROT|nr:undecaprenyl-phosphate glucose phosphotransferase [Georgfuchsia toluolica]CAG4882390.1 Undecaprenyl-phosphate glucose phosphotransferase [Georgfuchsia toluolica]
MLDPCALVFSLWTAAYAINRRLDPNYLLLSLLVFSITFPGAQHLHEGLRPLVRRIVLGWLGIASLLLFFGYATQYIRHYDSDVIIAWLWLAPATQLGLNLLTRAAAPRILALQGNLQRVAIVGMNEQGLALAQQIADDRYSGKQVVGYFDDRDQLRLGGLGRFPMLGRIADLPAGVKALHISQLYLSLPMMPQSRMLSLLDELRDTTASIYFVPDIFVTDLIQGRMDTVGNIPVVAVCETPFTGLNGLVKRGSDIVLSLLILLLVSPLMLAVAVGIKLGSPGPVIFRQRRYGLAGEEIIVYKFRSMTLCEDGGQIIQASRNDSRITPIGAFIRKTSLDELPQFINVLQGRMSIVGPRPHAVAHNEMYRKLIKGYMVRHKVRPGITGWAQVNGLRGETEILDKMKDRIEYDLDYLHNWSLFLDLRIILRTVLIVLMDQHAYRYGSSPTPLATAIWPTPEMSA